MRIRHSKTTTESQKQGDPMRLTYIYFIEMTGHKFIKIGITTDPRKRLAQLQTACPYVLSLLGYIQGDLGEESALHKRFEHLLTQGEWFKAEDDLMRYICDALEPTPTSPLPRRKAVPEWQEMRESGFLEIIGNPTNLGREDTLILYRTWKAVEWAKQGATVNEIAGRLEVPVSTAAFHLSVGEYAGIL